MSRVFNLEKRLVCFSVSIIKVTEKMPHSFSGRGLANQMSRCGTSCALNYGEAQSAESRADFIQKMKIALKELRETNVCLQIAGELNWFAGYSLAAEIKECNEIISIFVKSIQTAQLNKSSTK